MRRRGTLRSGGMRGRQSGTVRAWMFGWTLALLAIALFARLGFWQYGRMQEKQARLDAVAEVLREKRPTTLVDAPPPGGQFAWVEQQGRIEADTLLLDNQTRDGRQGLRVYCLLDVGSGHRLVDFGWLPLPGDRSLPDVACPAGPMRVRGLRMDPPSVGIAVGNAMQAAGPHRWLMARVDTDAIAAATGYKAWPVVVRLDPTLPVGHARDFDVLPNTMPPERHLGYAVQWWALALAVFVTALVLTFSKRRARA